MKDSSWGRLIGALVAPGETFRSIAERPTWVVPFIVLLALGFGMRWLMDQRIDPEQAVREQTEAFGLELTQEQIDEQVEMSRNPRTRALGVGAAVVGVTLLYLFAALLIWVGFRMFGSELGYRTALSTFLYGLMPLGLAAVLNVPLILTRETITAEETLAGGVLASHLGFLAGEETPIALLSLLHSVDFFSIWSIILLVIGYRTAARVSTGTATAVVLSVWLLGVALKVGLMALPAMLMGGKGS